MLSDRYDDLRCPKCGGTTSIYWWRYGGNPRLGYQVFEGLVGRCERCGYEWRVKAIDDIDRAKEGG